MNNMSEEISRIVVLDTETTGMNREGGPHYEGHNIIEIGAVEIINRKLTGRHFHVYIKADREIDPEAIDVHGITDEFLRDKPTYQQIHDEFLAFIKGAELIAHNAPFDVGFIDYEWQKLDASIGKTEDFCQITDTLAMAKSLFPGKRNNLDILCERYGIDNSHRTLHGALLDAEILADVYLLMTGGQTALEFNIYDDVPKQGSSDVNVAQNLQKTKIVRASAQDINMHNDYLTKMKIKGNCLWLN